MQALLFIIVIMGALITITGGIWVAAALIKTISYKIKSSDETSESEDVVE